MFERFTNRAQEVIGEAKKAAAQLEQNYIGTEHLLLGLVRVSDSVASKLLQEQGVTEERLEELISSLITPTGSVSVRCICKGWRCGSGKGRCGITSVYKKCRK